MTSSCSHRTGPPIADLISHCQGKTVLVPTREMRSEGVASTLARYLRRTTRVIYYNLRKIQRRSLTREEANEVAKFAIERDLVVIADEAYEDLVYDGEHVSIASLEGMLERTSHPLPSRNLMR